MAALAVLAVIGCGGGSDASSTSPPAEAGPRPAHTRDPVRLVTDLRAVGFFRGSQPAKAVADQALADYEKEWGEQLELVTVYDELAFAAQDRKRVWWNDLELDALPGNEAYVTAFKEWAAISRGTFRPQRVREKWRGELGPVTVSFDLDGQRRTAHGAALDGWLDPCVLLADVNPLIAGSGRQFVMHEAFDQTAYVLAVTRAERATLERYGWRFADGSNAYDALELGETTEGDPPRGCASR